MCRYDGENRKFKRRNPGGGLQRTFVQYVLEPIYKVYAQCVGEQKEDLKETLAEIGVHPPFDTAVYTQLVLHPETGLVHVRSVVILMQVSL